MQINHRGQRPQPRSHFGLGLRRILRQRTVAALAALWLTLAVLSPRSEGQPLNSTDNLSDEHVQKAIDAIVAELYARRNPDRFWEPEKIPPGDSIHQRGGYTALTVMALLYAGQSYQSPALRDAVDYLAASGLEGTYAIALRANVWAKLPPKFKDKMTADIQWLLDGFSEQVGGWDYQQNSHASRKDNSIRQFGALALWEAAKRGTKIERRYWQRLEDAYIDLQLADGGWNYTGDGPATGSMTAAGLATLFITQDFLHAAEAVRIGPERNNRNQQAIDKGLRWMDEHFSATENPGRSTYFYYYLYGVERVGLASGYKFFGSHDWYREGAAELIRRLCRWDEAAQRFSIHATTAGDGRASKIKTDDLAFALLFLSRGRVPVAINKLEIPSLAWNNRPRDVANLTNWIGENSETDLSWQIVSLNGEPEAWLEAPMLYLASHEPLPWMKNLKFDFSAFTREYKEYLRKRSIGEIAVDAPQPAHPDIPELLKLKRYIELGGMIFAVNEGVSKNFAESIEKAGALMFPQYEWRALPADHWAYGIHTPVKTKLPLRGLSNGVRDLIIVAPSGDMAETFQKNDTKQAGEYHIATNIYFAASELNRPRPRLAQSAHRAAPASQPRASVFIARGLHEDNCNPEPQALIVFSKQIAAQRGVDLKIIDQPLAKINELTGEARPALVIISGIDEHTFSQPQIDAIAAYIKSGGVILFETPGGRGAFTASAEQMATTLFNKPIQSVLHSRIITGEGLPGAVDVSRCEYRPYALQLFGARETGPRLRGMTVSGEQPQILFSREDISQALLDQPCWGISGYAPRTARELLANIVQHALALRER